MKSLNFALVGVAGFVAPRHLQAIKDNNGNLICSFDLHDSVGILDKYFPESLFFINENDFLESIKSHKIDFLIICTPNFLHFHFIKIALNMNIKIICEKPAVIEKNDLLFLQNHALKNNINVILQLRLHEKIMVLKNELNTGLYKVNLKYYTKRGHWYLQSWKGDKTKSGGIIFNIGIHFFDMLLWLFGECEKYKTNEINDEFASGNLFLQRAVVEWELSLKKEQNLREMTIENIHESEYENLKNNKILNNFEGKDSYLQDLKLHDWHLIDSKNIQNLKTKQNCIQNLKLQNTIKINFTDGFDNLHSKSYEKIINNKGFKIDETATSIKLVYDISNDTIFKK